MAVKHIDLEDRYIPATRTEDIIVEVGIGDSGDETGSYAIFSGTNFIEANAPANLGNKAAIGKKKTTVSVTVPDVLKETNWTSITVYITEGVKITQYGPYRAEVEAHLDTAVYTLKISHQ